MDDPPRPEETVSVPGDPVPAAPVEAAEAAVVFAPPPEGDPFWGYSDFLLFIGLAVPAMLLGWAVFQGLIRIFRLQVTIKALEIVPEQFLGYLFLFGSLAMIFRLQYGKPFWRSLGWTPINMPGGLVVLAGIVAAVGVAMTSTLIGTPNVPNQMTELMRERAAMILLGIFGTTAGPLAEELMFRGFLQPLLVRTFGAAAGIVLAALPFGMLHFQEYGYSWRHVVLISMAGAAFGWMRHATGSTKAATLMHASYNALFFAAAFGRTFSNS